jgi:beta-phosphoglucomutase-like phosphatase (HAD superfamily)
MPGYDVFVPLIKGWLGPEIDALYEPLRAYLLQHTELGRTPAQLDIWRPRLVRLAEHFRRSPAKLALVTASIAYETHACMKEVVHLMAEQVQRWPVPAARKDRLAERLADYRAVFDGFACASDVWEARLKPHRDLYSLALFQMSVPKPDYRFCVGLEDTEPGIISLRAAGVGCAIALPNRDTSRQDYSAAAEVIRGGLPELVLGRNLLLREA